MGAINSIVTDDYDLENCKVQDFSLLQWVEVCDSQTFCSENDIEELQMHQECIPLANLLLVDAAKEDISENAICNCVNHAASVPKCIVNDIPLAEWQ